MNNPMSPKVYPFNRKEPKRWFDEVDYQFGLLGWTDKIMKYYYVLSLLSKDYAPDLWHLTSKPPDEDFYYRLRTVLINTSSGTHYSNIFGNTFYKPVPTVSVATTSARDPCAQSTVAADVGMRSTQTAAVELSPEKFQRECISRFAQTNMHSRTEPQNNHIMSISPMIESSTQTSSTSTFHRGKLIPATQARSRQSMAVARLNLGEAGTVSSSTADRPTVDAGRDFSGISATENWQRHATSAMVATDLNQVTTSANENAIMISKGATETSEHKSEANVVAGAQGKAAVYKKFRYWSESFLEAKDAVKDVNDTILETVNQLQHFINYATPKVIEVKKSTKSPNNKCNYLRYYWKLRLRRYLSTLMDCANLLGLNAEEFLVTTALPLFPEGFVTEKDLIRQARLYTHRKKKKKRSKNVKRKAYTTTEMRYD